MAARAKANSGLQSALNEGAVVLTEDVTQSTSTGRSGIDTVIEVHGLEKAYGDHRAVRGIDIEVARGEVVAFLGPNGAGKTTTVEILEGGRSAYEGRSDTAEPRPESEPNGRNEIDRFT